TVMLLPRVEKASPQDGNGHASRHRPVSPRVPFPLPFWSGCPRLDPSHALTHLAPLEFLPRASAFDRDRSSGGRAGERAVLLLRRPARRPDRGTRQPAYQDAPSRSTRPTLSRVRPRLYDGWHAGRNLRAVACDAAERTLAVPCRRETDAG